MGERRVAIVTGASRGIGRAIADRLAADGFDLAICGTRENTIQEVAGELSDSGVEVMARALDVAEREAVEGFVKEVSSHFGRLDVLVNNAGITRDNLILRMQEDDWRQVIDTNLSSVFFASKAVLRPMMKARFGRIINISSVVAGMGNPGQANYCASKGGIEALTRSLAREVASRNITVNAVAPGFIATDMTAEMTDEARQAMTGAVPLARLGTPEDIAAAVAFLSGGDASYVTGQVLHVNGGLYL